MQDQSVLGASVDVCDACGGVWVDVDDGDVTALAAAVRVPDAADELDASPDRATCPRCRYGLTSETIRDVDLHRCTSCGGRFIPREALDRVIWLEPEDFARPMPLREALVAWLRWLRAKIDRDR